MNEIMKPCKDATVCIPESQSACRATQHWTSLSTPHSDPAGPHCMLACTVLVLEGHTAYRANQTWSSRATMITHVSSSQALTHQIE